MLGQGNLISAVFVGSGIGCEEDMTVKGKSSSELPTEMEQGCVLSWCGEEPRGWRLPAEWYTLNIHALSSTCPCTMCHKYDVGDRVWVLGP